MHSETKKIPRGTLLAIVGPTASGKSDLAIALARKYDGEIISADSRQVYRGMDIGTGKVTRDKQLTTHNLQQNSKTDQKSPSSVSSYQSYISEGIRHHLIDVADPDEEYNISHFLRDARASIDDIRARGKLPIICGGTHFWIQALLEDTGLPAVPPNPTLRQRLASHTPKELFLMLKNQDPKRAESIDRHNTVRLIRALEICAALGTVPPLCHPGLDPGSRKTLDSRLRGNDNIVIIALSPPKEILRERIKKRLESRLAEGMVDEVAGLRKSGQSWERLEAFGLEYRYIALLLQAKITETEMREELSHAIWHYAKRQLSWLRRWERQGATIRWISDPQEAEQILMHTSDIL